MYKLTIEIHVCGTGYIIKISIVCYNMAQVSRLVLYKNDCSTFICRETTFIYDAEYKVVLNLAIFGMENIVIYIYDFLIHKLACISYSQYNVRSYIKEVKHHICEAAYHGVNHEVNNSWITYYPQIFLYVIKTLRTICGRIREQEQEQLDIVNSKAAVTKEREQKHFDITRRKENVHQLAGTDIPMLLKRRTQKNLKNHQVLGKFR